MATPNPGREEAKDFRHSIFNLLNRHPLYSYCAREGSGYRLSVLLIGSGGQLDQLRNMILSHGQLLNTRLEVTVVTEDVAAEAAALNDSAPELSRFIQFRGIQPTHPLEWDLGTLAYEQETALRENLPAILARHNRCLYVLIGENCVTDAVRDLSPAPGQLLAWIEDDAIHTCGQAQEVFGPVLNASLSDELYDIAYRIHYAYEKGKDPRKTDREIRKSFVAPYNHASNIECAIHVRSKIWSAGIDPDVPDFAERFSRKFDRSIQSRQSLWQDLAQLEHRRWCISKLMKGFRKGNPEHFCRAPGETSHYPAEKRHACLVRYGKSVKIADGYCRRLTDDDWDVTDPGRLEDLDPLDQQTLRVHKRCGELLQERLDSALQKLDDLKKVLDDDLASCADTLGDIIREMYPDAPVDATRTDDADPVSRYQEQLHSLHRLMQLQGLDGDIRLLDQLLTDMTVPVEYWQCKDYKEVNFDIIHQIALYIHKVPALVKLMSRADWECVGSAYHFRPERLILVDIAETLPELKNIRQQATWIDKFLKNHRPGIQTCYHIFTPQTLRRYSGKPRRSVSISQLKEDSPELFADWACEFHSLDTLNSDTIEPIFGGIMQDFGVTAIDTTHCNQTFVSLADDYAHLGMASAFWVENNRIRNLRGKQILDHIVLDTGFSVQELFDIAKTHKIKQDSAVLSDTFLRQYEALWAIASDPKTWYRFYQSFSGVYTENLPIDQKKLDSAIDAVAAKAVRSAKDSPAEKEQKQAQMRRSLHAIREQLVASGILVPDPVSAAYAVSCGEALAAFRNPGKVLEYYIYCTIKCSDLFTDVAMSWFFRHGEDASSAKNEIDVICTHKNASLFISAKHVNENTFDSAFLQEACMQVHWLAHRFGGPNPKPILAAPVMSVYGRNGDWNPYIKRAKDWGVYLLGRECFEKNRLAGILDTIAQDDSLDPKQWCALLCRQSAV